MITSLRYWKPERGQWEDYGCNLISKDTEIALLFVAAKELCKSYLNVTHCHKIPIKRLLTHCGRRNKATVRLRDMPGLLVLA